MEQFIEPIRIVRSSTASQEDRTVVLATLSDAAMLWRQTASLEAYKVIIAALDSNDGEVRRVAEGSLNRKSPRPANHGVQPTGGATPSHKVAI